MSLEMTIEELKVAVEKRRPLPMVTHLTTHERPHLDEIAAFTLIVVYGGKMFPNLKKKFQLGTISGATLRKKYSKDYVWYELLREGYLTIGTGGGPLDDHIDGKGNARKSGSATERVAEFLGIQDRPELTDLLRYVEYEDNNGDNPSLTGSTGPVGKSAQRFMLGTMIKTTWRTLGKNPQKYEVEQWIVFFMNMIKNQLTDQRESIDTTPEVMESTREVLLTKMTPRHKGTVPVLAVIHHDYERASDIVRRKLGKKLELILQIKSNGQFQIFPASKKNIDLVRLDDVVKALRSVIIEWKNRQLSQDERIPNTWKETCKEGSHPDTEELHYFRSAGMIFNGSLTQPDTPPLVGEDEEKFPFDERALVDTISMVLEDHYWPEEVEPKCSSGMCPAKIEGYRCPVYLMGFTRCYTNRKNHR